MLQEKMANVYIVYIHFIQIHMHIYIYIYAHTHSSTKLWFSLVADMLTVKAKIPQKSHPVDCGDVAGCARGVTNLPIKWHVFLASCEAQNIPMTLSLCH